MRGERKRGREWEKRDRDGRRGGQREREREREEECEGRQKNEVKEGG